MTVASIDFFHFGRDRRLFGSFVPASAGGGASTDPSSVAVLCYPFGQEYVRAHKAFRQMALLLGRRGIPVLRFDYSCTGDSAGRGEEADPAAWVEDVRTAVDEARQRSGRSRVRLAGLRLGATLAALAARDRDDVERLVLWDPVVSGPDYVAELETHADVRYAGTWWVHGFPVTAAMRDAVRQLDLRESLHAPGTRVVQVLSRQDSAFDALQQALSDRGVDVESRVVPSPSDWNYTDSMGGILLPRDIMRGVVDSLAE